VKNLRTLWKLFWVFFKVGCFTFGGGLAMLPLIQKEVVDKQKWIEEEDILDTFAIAQSAPGVIAVNTSILIGRNVAGVNGAVAAVLGVVLPAFLSIILLLMLLMGLTDNIYVGKVFTGIRAASAALILMSAIKLGKAAIKGKMGYFIALISFLLIIVFNISAAWAVVFGGITGYAVYWINRRKKQ
jgi:chromate transporter